MKELYFFDNKLSLIGGFLITFFALNLTSLKAEEDEGVETAEASVASAMKNEEKPEKKPEAVYQNIHVLQQKQVLKDDRLEITPGFGFTINNKFKKHLFVGSDIVYHLNDNLGLQFIFAKTFASNTLVNDEIQNAASVEAVVPDIFIRWIASAGVTLTPFYGKAVIQGSDLFYYDVYLESAFSLVKTEVNIKSESLVSPHTLPGGMFGVGFRFYMEDWFALRIAIRDYIFADDSSYIGALENDQSKKGNVYKSGEATTGIFDNMFLYFGFSYLL